MACATPLTRTHKNNTVPNFVERIFEAAYKAASKILSTKFGTVSLFSFVPGNNGGSTKGMEEEIEAQKRRGGVLADAKRLNIDGMNNCEIAVLPMTNRRGGSNKAGQSAVIAQLKGASWQS